MSGYTGPAVLICPSTWRLLVAVVVVVAAILMISEIKWQNQRRKTKNLVVGNVYMDERREGTRREGWARRRLVHFSPGQKDMLNIFAFFFCHSSCR